MRGYVIVHMSCLRCSEDKLVQLGSEGLLDDIVESILSVLSVKPVHHGFEFRVDLEGGQGEGGGNPVEDCLGVIGAHSKLDGVLLSVCLANTMVYSLRRNISTEFVIFLVNKLGDLDKHLDRSVG